MKKIIIIVIAIFFYSQNGIAQCSNKESVPEEMFRGRYKEIGMSYGNPYTMFNKRTPNWNLDATLAKIRRLIISGKNDVLGHATLDYAIMYRDIYIYDTTTNEPLTCPSDKQCAHPKWTKNQALVSLIGLRYANVLGKDTFTVLNSTDRNPLLSVV